MSIFSKLSSSPLLRLLLAVLAGIFLVAQGFQLKESESQLVAQTIFGTEFNLSWIFCFLFDLLCVALAIVVISKINSTHRFVDRSMFPLFVFLFIGLTTWPQFLLYPESTFTTLIGIFVLSLLLQMYKQGNILVYIFTASILVSIASLFYSPSLILLPLIFIGYSVFRPFDLRGTFLGLIGFGLIFLYLFGLGYVFDWQFSWEIIEQWKEVSVPSFHFVWQQLASILFILISLVAIWRMYGLRQTLIVRQRNQLSLVFIFFIFYATLSLFYGISKSLLMVLVPLSIAFLFHYQNEKRKWVIEVMLLLILSFNTWLSFFN